MSITDTTTNVLHGYRCQDCLSRWTFPGLVRNGFCLCGGKADWQCRIASGRIVITQTACDERCTHATGAHCDCSCGGINHGTGAVIEILGAVFQTKLTENATAVAAAWREGLAATTVAVKEFEAMLRAAAKANTSGYGSGYLSPTDYAELTAARSGLYHAKKAADHKKRMNHLQAALDVIDMHGEDLS